MLYIERTSFVYLLFEDMHHTSDILNIPKTAQKSAPRIIKEDNKLYDWEEKTHKITSYQTTFELGTVLPNEKFTGSEEKSDTNIYGTKSFKAILSCFQIQGLH